MHDPPYTKQRTYTLILRQMSIGIARERINLAIGTPVLWFAMVTLDTLLALHEQDHQLAAYCPTCERWAVLDLKRLIAEGAR